MARTKPTPAAPVAQPFVFGCDVTVFPPEELAALERYGPRFEALACGSAHPSTDEEKRFLKVHREESKPKTVAERAWLRLKARREFEQEERQTPPPAPQENYDMVEFDADRCWW